ncbi:hypothetical protein RND81_05G064600 [Saponaria officinalis]|uniref:Uncharacterized protein n=1 Tax=Saponaria officinalis TaxID=3572 RepID=A0AAW1KW19_SAPOF
MSKTKTPLICFLIISLITILLLLLSKNPINLEKTPIKLRDVLPILPKQISWPILRTINSAVDLSPTFVGAASSADAVNNSLVWKGACFYSNTAWLEFHNKTGSQFGGGILHIKVRKFSSKTDIYRVEYETG